MDTLGMIKDAFGDYDDEKLVQALEDGLKLAVPPAELLEHLSGVLEEIGELFAQGELFLPDMVLAGDMMERAMTVLNPVLTAQVGCRTGKKIVLGTVRGDIHDIGKNMVKMMMSNAGYEVTDLGTDVSPETFYYKAVEIKADVLALSSCMTTTVPGMRDTIDLMRAKNLDKTCKIIAGGGSMNAALAAQLGAHLYSVDACDAVRVLREYFAQEEVCV